MNQKAPEPIFVGDQPLVAPQPAVPEFMGRLADSDLGHLRRVLVELKKALKTAMFNRHRTDQFEQYVAPAYSLLAAFLEVHKVCELKLEVSTIAVGDTPIYEDDSAEANIIYPLWSSGIRLLIFKEGVEPLELLRFFLTVVDYKRSERQDDLATVLWKAAFRGIEWVVVQDFDLGDDDDNREVEIEVEKVLSFIQDQLRSETSDAIGFARVSLADLDVKLEQLEQIRSTVLRQANVERADQRTVQSELLADERHLLQRICAILLEVMRLPSRPSELQDIEQALEQLLDGLILEGQFGTVDKLLSHTEAMTRDAHLPQANREMARTLSDRLFMLMHEGQRVRAIGTALNSGRGKDLDGLKRYLMRMGPTVAMLLLDLLDNLNAPQHRRVVADVLVSVGQQGVPVFARRLTTASSNLAKDLLYIINEINPPNKVELFAPILKHENAVLRMEGLATIGRTKDERCFHILEDVYLHHDVPQMRAHAARILSEYPGKWVEPLFLHAVKDPKWEEKADGEKRAVVGAMVKLESENTRNWVRGIFQEKSGLFSKKADERKLMAISALMALPGMPSLQLLSDVAKDHKLHSAEVCEAARSAALEVKKRLMGEGG